MAIVTGDRYLEKLVKFVEEQAGPLIEGTVVLKLNPAGLHYVQSRLEALHELESLLAGAPVDYLRAYVSDLGDHRALEQLRRILRLLTSLKVVSVLPSPTRDPTPLSLVPFGRLRVLELRGCDLSTLGAKGLLELRHTLEKIICHNSTDALRHVFASRIAEIKDSPQWNRLSFVSCACNGLLLMDESMQLLPAVETLDLSRNKFAKADNLRKCVKLKHLDLGFNHLRTVSSFSEVSCHIVKLVLRNNALTTLHGIENLKSLEGLDVSYNIISNFSELEFLSGLPSLQSLWLEGNPLCCARWYRPQAFSYINNLYNFKLDDMQVSTREFWKRQLIIASRQKRPASFGFYSPAIYDAKGEGSINRRRRKVTRLASIGGEGESTYLCSDQESVSIDNEVQSREENVLSDDDAEILDLMNKVELMKKERSVLWLREFTEWMDHVSENFIDLNKNSGTTSYLGGENLVKTKTSQRHGGDCSRYVSDSVQASGDESSTNVLESDSSFMDMSAGLHAHQYFDQIGLMGLKEEHLKAYERISGLSAQAKSFLSDSFTNQVGHRIVEDASVSPLTTIGSISESHSSAHPGSPPHYREDILHRRQYLEEEIMQLSAESYSVASSDSNTSCSDDDACAFGPMSDLDRLVNEKSSNTIVEGHPCLENFEDKYCDPRHQIPHVRENGQCSTDSSADVKDHFMRSCSNDSSEARDGRVTHVVNQKDDLLCNRKSKRKTKRRVVPLLQDNNLVGKIETSQKSNGNLDFPEAGVEKDQQSQLFDGSNFQQVSEEKQALTSTGRTELNTDAHGSPMVKWSCRGSDDFIENYFNTSIADSRNHESCCRYMRCDCIIEMDSLFRERDVALVLSSEKKLYVLLISATSDGSGNVLSLWACHNVEDIREVLVGVGLQVVSLEQVQVELFEKQMFGGLKVNIIQYSMVLFWHNEQEEDSWLPRSLFVVGVHLLVCVEDLVKFGSLLVDASLPAYFSLDSCCSVADIAEMIVEAEEKQCVTVALSRATSAFHSLAKAGKEVEKLDKEKMTSGSLIWKLKWFSKDGMFKFVALLKAIRAGTSMSPLPLRCIP
ncbi:LRR domain containing protein [Parasponia andersonii]|uniref:LRR domain containing protein n=1 Tax=Parasponia andersonii TaxID=3476 RepID=A0A2P5B7A8_PARAD|nr:LRR domain containing protein [Parasponia andersonii]